MTSPARQYVWMIVVVTIVAASEIFGAIAEGSPVRITVLEQSTGMGGRTYGSGTVVGRDDQGMIVLTCAHLFRGRVSAIYVCAGAAGCNPGQLIARDDTHDLAAVRIAEMAVELTPIATQDPRQGELLIAAGYGQDGRYQSRTGKLLGYSRAGAATTYETLTMSGAIRDGDSGGPITNAGGELVGVLWGTDGRTIAGSCCGRIRQLLGPLGRSNRQRLAPIQPSPPIAATPPDAPAPGPISPIVPRPPEGDLAPGNRRVCPGLGDLAAEVRALRDAIAGEQLGGIVRAEVEPLVGSLREQLAGSKLDVAQIKEALGQVAAGGTGTTGWSATLAPSAVALGWSTPPAAAALSAIWLGLRVLRRRKKRRPDKGRDATQPVAQEPALPGLDRGNDAGQVAALEAELLGARATITELRAKLEATPVRYLTPKPDDGLARMRQAMKATSDTYPAARSWVQMIEKAYTLILSGERHGQ